MIEMVVESVRVNLQTYHRVVVLKERDSDRYLPIWIGNNEADAIVIQLQNVSVPRPQTHDLLKSVVTQMGGKVERIVVNDLSDDVFYARIIVDMKGQYVDIDSRPSDAIALAVRVKAPIFVEDSVLEKAGVSLKGESLEEAVQGRMGENKPTSDDELKQLSAFKDFINSLDLDDLGGPKAE
jgi:uncharacterized protein